ncbi:hypothetical protein AS160_08690 [Marinitoga sp. 38H-ov]|nr:hypothetical protein AS160_08690 [Marinitoga sp. 38H-ov]
MVNIARNLNNNNSNLKELVKFINDNQLSLPSELVNIARNLNNNNSNLKELVKFINDNQLSLPSELVNIARNLNNNNSPFYEKNMFKTKNIFKQNNLNKIINNTKKEKKIIISKDIINNINSENIIKLNLSNELIVFLSKNTNNFIKLNNFTNKFFAKNKLNFNKTPLKNVFENKINKFINSSENEKNIYSDKNITIKISKYNNFNLKDLLETTSKNISEYKNVKKYYNQNLHVIVEPKKRNINIKNIFKQLDSIIYKIEKKNSNKTKNVVYLNKNRNINNYYNKIDFLHPSINTVNINIQKNNIKTLSIKDFISNINNTIEKINNVPKYFERTIFKINPPDLGNLEVTIIKSQKYLKIEFNLENIDNKAELEKRIESLLNSFKDNFDKVDFTIKSEMNNNDENKNESNKNNDENNTNSNDDNKENEDKKRKNNRNDFIKYLRGEYND